MHNEPSPTSAGARIPRTLLPSPRWPERANSAGTPVTGRFVGLVSRQWEGIDLTEMANVLGALAVTHGRIGPARGESLPGQDPEIRERFAAIMKAQQGCRVGCNPIKVEIKTDRGTAIYYSSR
jgi:hypothetical protein